MYQWHSLLAAFWRHAEDDKCMLIAGLGWASVKRNLHIPHLYYSHWWSVGLACSVMIMLNCTRSVISLSYHSRQNSRDSEYDCYMKYARTYRNLGQFKHMDVFSFTVIDFHATTGNSLPRHPVLRVTKWLCCCSYMNFCVLNVIYQKRFVFYVLQNTIFWLHLNLANLESRNFAAF